MILTKEQQEEIVSKYVKEKHTTDECIGFIDGINATLELVNKIMNESNKNKNYGIRRKDNNISSYR